jgi:dephospho-CoA kinase
MQKNRKPLTVALTGGIGSGKSTVADIFNELGVPVIDTDAISRELVRPGSECLAKICQRFGNDIINKKGQLKRKALRKRIFQSPKDKVWLEKLLHPRIYEVSQRRIKEQTYPYVIVVIPLLIESGKKKSYNRVLVIDAPESLQIKRASERDGLSSEQIKLMIATQCPHSQRIAAADDIITNNGDLKSLKEQVQTLHQEYLQLAGR